MKEQDAGLLGTAASGSSIDPPSTSNDMERFKRKAKHESMVLGNTLNLNGAQMFWLEGELLRAMVAGFVRGRALEPARDSLRAAWEAGFRLCRSYGDNHAHFDGEQKERQWRAYLQDLEQEQPK